MLIKISNLSSTEKEEVCNDSIMDKDKEEKKQNYWMESGMESDVAPDEMYLMLQADMLSIKRQEKALQCEIEEIKSKFVSLVETCGINSGDFPIAESTKIINSPSFICRSTSSLTRVTALSITDEECLLQQMMQGSVCSSSSESLYENSGSVKMITDNNSNYKTSPQMMIPDNTLVSVPSMLVPNITEPLSSSDISNSSSACTNSSDGYPRSTETSSDNDNQCVPCIDFEEELASRTKYYSDFTIDRQRKINDMSTKSSNNDDDDNESEKYSDNGSTEEIFTREVEGCEASDLPPVRVAPIGGDLCSDSRTNFNTRSRANSGTDSSSIPSPSHHRRQRRSRYSSSNHSSSSASSRRSNSIPQASSTMIEDFSPQSSQSSGSSKHKSSSIPRASSTMIEDIPSSKTSSQCSSAEDLASIYTWSIHDTSEDVCLEDSYMKKMGHEIVAKPPHSGRTSSSSSGSSRGSRKSSKRDRNSRKIEHVLPVPCSVLSDSISVIEQVSGLHDAYLGADSLYEDENIQYKASTLPRTSTRINLLTNNKSSGSSSMEAKCSSMPDMLSVCTPNDFHSVPNSDDDDDDSADNDDSSPLQERLDLPGKSSSSGSHVSPPDNTGSSMVAPNNTDALMDSILTDSPTSIGSSGIAAPYNSYNSPDSLPASRASQSTASDNKSETSYQQPSAPPSSVVSSPVVSAVKSKPDSIFKIPVNTQPLKNLFKFKRSRGKSAEKVVTSTPNHGYPSSVRSDPLSKRKLFTASTPRAQEVQLMDKKAVIKKFKKFSESFHKRDRSGLIRIQTLANL